ncbi:hypothetical protein TARUN_8993 [Trichoderma arundinaceum]|uniref:Uncharacterized protein n=1 Tax=Trichoderma arundinaceum TaxID=490622 RepID=A0A395NB73_TRIAR|nr:hypothetical protein TARUN_8993 [Trichoderma arundinaceum]
MTQALNLNPSNPSPLPARGERSWEARRDSGANQWTGGVSQALTGTGTGKRREAAPRRRPSSDRPRSQMTAVADSSAGLLQWMRWVALQALLLRLLRVADADADATAPRRGMRRRSKRRKVLGWMILATITKMVATATATAPSNDVVTNANIPPQRALLDEGQGPGAAAVGQEQDLLQRTAAALPVACPRGSFNTSIRAVSSGQFQYHQLRQTQPSGSSTSAGPAGGGAAIGSGRGGGPCYRQRGFSTAGPNIPAAAAPSANRQSSDGAQCQCLQGAAQRRLFFKDISIHVHASLTGGSGERERGSKTAPAGINCAAAAATGSAASTAIAAVAAAPSVATASLYFILQSAITALWPRRRLTSQQIRPRAPVAAAAVIAVAVAHHLQEPQQQKHRIFASSPAPHPRAPGSRASANTGVDRSRWQPGLAALLFASSTRTAPRPLLFTTINGSNTASTASSTTTTTTVTTTATGRRRGGRGGAGIDGGRGLLHQHCH